MSRIQFEITDVMELLVAHTNETSYTLKEVYTLPGASPSTSTPLYTHARLITEWCRKAGVTYFFMSKAIVRMVPKNMPYNNSMSLADFKDALYDMFYDVVECCMKTRYIDTSGAAILGLLNTEVDDDFRDRLADSVSGHRSWSEWLISKCPESLIYDDSMPARTDEDIVRDVAENKAKVKKRITDVLEKIEFMKAAPPPQMLIFQKGITHQFIMNMPRFAEVPPTEAQYAFLIGSKTPPHRTWVLSTVDFNKGMGLVDDYDSIELAEDASKTVLKNLCYDNILAERELVYGKGVHSLPLLSQVCREHITK